jgi:hypothetical protein
MSSNWRRAAVVAHPAAKSMITAVAKIFVFMRAA